MLQTLLFAAHGRVGEGGIELLHAGSEKSVSYVTDNLEMVSTGYNFSKDSDLPYCRDASAELGNRTVGPGPGYSTVACRVLDRHEITVSEGTSMNSFFATCLEAMHQRRCEHPDTCKRVWETLEVDLYFVKDFENYVLKLDHAAPSMGGRINVDTVNSTQGFLWDSDGSTCVLPVKSGHDYRTSFYNFRRWQRVKVCKGAFSVFSDYMPITRVLRAMNTTLEDSREPGGPTHRRQGIEVMLEISYTNLDPFDFWQWPIGPKMKYTYRYHMISQRFGDAVKSYWWSSHGETFLKERVLKRYMGMQLTAVVNGRIGVFSFRLLLVTLAVHTSMVCLADIILKKIVLWIYFSFRGRLKKVSLMHQYYSFDESPPEDEFVDAMNSDSIAHLDSKLSVGRRAQIADRPSWKGPLDGDASSHNDVCDWPGDGDAPTDDNEKGLLAI